MSVILLVLAAYAGLLLLLRLNEDRLVYFPDRQPPPLPPAALGLRVEPVSFPGADGIRLTGWVIPSTDTRPSEWWLLVFHGNAGNLATGGRPEHDRQLRDLGLNILALDYRGYGASEGTPSEAGLYADAEGAYAYLRSRGVPADRIVIYGHSLGSAVAIDLASRVAAAGLIVEGAFTSATDLGQEAYPFVPVRLIARSRFASIEKISQVTVPKLFIHGRSDATIPIRHGRRLFEAAPEPKTFLEVAGGHDDAFQVGAVEYEAGIARFLTGLGAMRR